MHTRHEALFRWLMQRFPRSRLYGPYHHGGRSYYQWMARGRVLVEDCAAASGAENHPRPRCPCLLETRRDGSRNTPPTSPVSVPGSTEADWPERAAPLAPLAQRFALSEGQLAALRAFGLVLVRDEHAPTTVHDPVRVRDDHLADALVALELPAFGAAGRIADIGAGAGIPGIPLAIAPARGPCHVA